MNQSPTEVEKARGLHRFAVLTAGATFCLIFVGGLVTSTGSALAVPDWPLAFGKLIPAWQGGIRFEFGHRLAAGTVVVLTLVLMAWAWRAEQRRWVRDLVMLAFDWIDRAGRPRRNHRAVRIAARDRGGRCRHCAGAILPDGIDRDLHQSAMGHDAYARSAVTNPADDACRRVTTAIIYTQILVGAVMTALSAGLVIPRFSALVWLRGAASYWNEFIAINFAHRCGAIVVTAMVRVDGCACVADASRASSRYAVRRSGCSCLLVLQICLGAITIWSGRSVIPTTSHVAVGAAVLATSLTLTLRAYHILAVRNRAHAIKSRTSSRIVERQVTA